ncbi:MAG: site-2 protease family protein [Clostridia bacterium]|nr:site-2 protease family protein [Clostridia bacterium]
MGLYSIFASNQPFYIMLVVLLAWLIAIIFAITIREFVRAYVSNKMGDPTAKLSGQLSLNPAKHIDPLGMLFLVVFGFGWTKGVQTNPNLYKNFRKGQIWVSLSGIITNLCLGIIFTFVSVVAELYFNSDVIILLFLQYLFYFFAIINYVLVVINILPIYPLDGYAFLQAFLSYNNKFMVFMRRYGLIILIVLILSQLLGLFINLVLQVLYTDLFNLFAKIFI